MEFARKFDELWANNNRGELAPAKYWDFVGGDATFAEFRAAILPACSRTPPATAAASSCAA